MVNEDRSKHEAQRALKIITQTKCGVISSSVGLNVFLNATLLHFSVFSVSLSLLCLMQIRVLCVAFVQHHFYCCYTKLRRRRRRRRPTSMHSINSVVRCRYINTTYNLTVIQLLLCQRKQQTHTQRETYARRFDNNLVHK